MSSLEEKEFSIDGVAVDGETVIRIRKQIEEKIVDDMREQGFVPIIDMPPQLRWNYDPEKNEFRYTITVYGTYIGKKKAKEVLGIIGSKPIKIER